MKKIGRSRGVRTVLLSCLLLLALLAAGCSRTEPEVDPSIGEPTQAPDDVGQGTEEGEPTPTQAPAVLYSRILVDESVTYQTIESFGTSGCWWAQYVGGWDKPYREGELPVREEIAKLLYSREDGIGLTSYRYNLGAGSKEANKGNYWYEERRAENFEISAGRYDFTKDANAVWFLNQVVKEAEGDVDVVFFCNSPLVRLTVSGTGQSPAVNTVNLLPENYKAFADYVLDVTEHFIAEGIPVTEISPINEPQWDWLDGQEGCHYEPSEVRDILKVFVEEIGKREALSGVAISGPESGEWGGRTQEYLTTMLSDPVLESYFKAIDCHSYWTDKRTKSTFANWMKLNYPDVSLRMSEWCEMVNGTDYTMDSAFNMADVILEDLKILNVTTWQYWVGVANGGYRDGLIYVSTEKKGFKPNRRLWTLGNFSKFVRPGYVRVETDNQFRQDIYSLPNIAFTGTNDDGKQELVVVLVNRDEEKTFQLGLSETGKYTSYAVYTTSEERDLEQTDGGAYQDGHPFTICGESVVTIVLTAD